LASANVQLKAGRIKPFAVTSSSRNPFIMDVPTFTESAESELKNMEVNIWTGLFAPAGTPASVTVRIADSVAQTLRKPEFRAKLASQYIRAADTITPAQFSTLVNFDRSRWMALARHINLEVQ
jgi:tripartite-type tricarboxylate transporter receptor subunit TctC